MNEQQLGEDLDKLIFALRNLTEKYQFSATSNSDNERIAQLELVLERIGTIGMKYGNVDGVLSMVENSCENVSLALKVSSLKNFLSGKDPNISKENALKQKVPTPGKDQPADVHSDSPAKAKNLLDSMKQDRSLTIQDTIIKEALNLTFKNVVGLENAKKALFEAIILPMKLPHLFVGECKPWRSILLYGPAGTGKSFLASAVAGETRALFYCLSSTDLVSVWQGQSEKLVRELFDQALNQKRSAVIFIDEIDSLCRLRMTNESDAVRRIKTELLVQMQRLQQQSVSATSVFLLCATNCPSELDPAFIRRFQKRIFIDLPDTAARLTLLKQITEGLTDLSEEDWKIVGQQTSGYSGSDLRTLAQDVLYAPIRDLNLMDNGGSLLCSDAFGQENADGVNFNFNFCCETSFSQQQVEGGVDLSFVRTRKVVFADFVGALTRCSSTVTSENLMAFEEFTKQFGVRG